MKKTTQSVPIILIVLTILSVFSNLYTSGAESDAASPAGIEVLNNKGELRAFLVFRTPMVISSKGDLRAALAPTGKNPKPLPDFQSPLPSKNWTALDFNDSTWDRQLAPVEIPAGGATGRSHRARHTATVNSMICIRAKFKVEDLKKAGEIKLNLKYVGGACIYLNGKEIARKQLPKGELKPETMAEKYPDDLYCEPEGTFLQKIKANKAGFERRYRKITDLVLPSKLVRKGTNCLAIELRRAPINEKAIQAKRIPVGGMYVVPGIWAYVGLNKIRLSCASPGAVISSSARPKGVRVWNVAPFETIDAFSYGDPSEKLKPITIHAARNSVFSGRLAVSSDSTIKNLKAAVSNLKTADGKGTISASAVKVRHAEPAVPAKSWTPTERFDGLVEKIPQEIPVIKVRDMRRCRSPRKHRASGAAASLWFTVRTSKKQLPGRYSGTVSVSADGLKTVKVPIHVNVNAWSLPDPKDFRIQNMICMIPESISRHYKVKLWSEKHYEMMGRSMALLAEVNSREVAINLGTNFYGTGGNEETMVRWIKNGDGSYTYDFTVFDKYLDLVTKHFGKPMPLRLNCWGETDKTGKTNRCVKFVSLMDKTSGKIEKLEQPVFGTEESFTFWKPVIDKTLAKLKARGWLDVTTFGHNSYCYAPRKEVITIAKRLWPKGVWAYTAHNGVLGGKFKGTNAEDIMPVKFSSCVWTEGRLKNRGFRTLLKSRPGLWNDAARCRHWDRSPLIILRNLPEELIMRGHDGMSDFGSDNFPLENPKRKGRYFHLGAGRGTGGGNNASTRALLASGPDGATSSERFEMFREGIELSEAILFLEKALQEKKISGELAAKVDTYLSTRGETFISYWYTRGTNYINKWSIPGQFKNDGELLKLAAEVASKIGK